METSTNHRPATTETFGGGEKNYLRTFNNSLGAADYTSGDLDDFESRPRHKPRTVSSRNLSPENNYPDTETRVWDRDRNDSSIEHRNRHCSEKGRNRDRNKDRERDGFYKEHRTDRNRSPRERYSSHEKTRDSSRYHDRRDERRSCELKYKKEPPIPSHVVMLKGLSTRTTEDDIRAIIATNLYSLEDVRVIRDRITGESRGFAFADFSTVENAKKWIEDNQGSIRIDGVSVRIEFSKSVERRDEDWMCFRCKTTNFKRREFCFSCSAPKDLEQVIPLNDGEIDIGVNENNILLIRGLTKNTTAEDISVISIRFGIGIRDIRLIKDKKTDQSQGFAFFFFDSVELAKQFLLKTNGQMSLDGQTCAITFASEQSFVTQQLLGAAAAAAAMCAAQTAKAVIPGPWYRDEALYADSIATYLEAQQRQLTPSPEMPPLFPAPDIRVDPNTGYSYEARTGFYYDPLSQYFYNSQSQTYLYYDAVSYKYVAVSSALPTNQSETASETPDGGALQTDTEGGVLVQASQPQEMSAVPDSKKVVDDIKKWEKQQRKLKKKIEKEKLRQQQQQQQQQQPASEASLPFSAQHSLTSPSANVASSVEGNSHPYTLSTLAAGAVEPLAQVSAADAPDFELRAEIIEQLHALYLNFDLLQCLLCQKKLKTADLLRKHASMSKLHLSNLEPKVTEMYAEFQVTNRQKEGYRDRAAERRMIFGQPAHPVRTYPRRVSGGHKVSTAGKKKSPETELQTTSKALDETNKGNKMLRSMGWVEGTGLGKRGQGITIPIEATVLSQGVGLGSASLSYGISVSDSYHEKAKKISRARYEALQ